LEKENKRLKEIIKRTNMQTASKRANDETARVLVLGGKKAPHQADGRQSVSAKKKKGSTRKSTGGMLGMTVAITLTAMAISMTMRRRMMTLQLTKAVVCLVKV
jgi:hypothetical protein